MAVWLQAKVHESGLGLRPRLKTSRVCDAQYLTWPFYMTHNPIHRKNCIKCSFSCTRLRTHSFTQKYEIVADAIVITRYHVGNILSMNKD